MVYVKMVSSGKFCSWNPGHFKSLQFERKKLLQKAAGFEPTTQMVQYCRFSHDVTIIQNKNNSSPQTRPEKAHFIQMREKINGPPL